MTDALPENDRYVSLVLDAGQTDLPYDFKLLTEADLTVILDRGGVQTTLVEGVDFIFPLGLGDDSGGTAQLVVAAQDGDVYYLVGIEAIDRVSEFSASLGFDTDKLDGDVDKLTRIAQEARRDIGRALKPAFGASIPEGNIVLSGGQGTAKDGGPADAISTAEANAEAAAATLSEFYTRYLGARSEDPATDLEGNALVTGAIYFNTASGNWKYWDGDSWEMLPYATVADGAVTEQKVADGVLYPRVTTAQLKGLDTTKNANALVTDVGAGVVVAIWNPADMSANVTADPGGNWFIAPTSDATGASGAWVVTGMRFEDGTHNSVAANYIPDDTWFSGDWAVPADKGVYKKLGIVQGDLLVAPAPGNPYNDYGGVLPSFWVRSYKVGIPDGVADTKNWDGAPRTTLRGAIQPADHDDAVELNFRRVDTDDPGHETGNIISNPTHEPIGRISAQLYKQYTIRYVRAASTANFNTATLGAGTVMDGVTLAQGDLVLLRAQSNPAENGVWIVSSAGNNAIRATFANTWDEMVGLVVGVHEGNSKGQNVFYSQALSGGNLNATEIIFDQATYSYAVPAATGSANLYGFYHPWIGENVKVVQEDLTVADAYMQGEKSISLGIPNGYGTIKQAFRYKWPAFAGTWPPAANQTALNVFMTNAAGTDTQELKVKAATVANVPSTARVLYVDAAS